jgi:hypothetical protein
MGCVYFGTEQRELALQSYKKALEYAPENDECFWCDNSSAQLKLLETIE